MAPGYTREIVSWVVERVVDHRGRVTQTTRTTHTCERGRREIEERNRTEVERRRDDGSRDRRRRDRSRERDESRDRKNRRRVKRQHGIEYSFRKIRGKWELVRRRG